MTFKKENGTAVPVTYQYISENQQLKFDIPQVDVNSNYSFELVSKSQGTTSGTTSNTQTKTTAEGDVTEITNKQAQDIIRADGGKVLLGYNFHSSAFGTFKEKVDGINGVQDLFGKVSSDVIDLRKTVAPYEAFDLAEISGTVYTNSKPLLQPVALLDNAYYVQDIHPLNYEKYPVAGDITLSRDTTELGLAPTKALPILLSYQTNVEQGNFNTQFVNQRMPYIYDLPRIYKSDFQELQRQVVNRFLGTPVQKQYEWLINGHFPFMREGNYKVQYRFILPDGSVGTSATVIYSNPIK